MPDAQYWIDKLTLQPHPEGGFFRETYRSEVILQPSAFPALKGPRHVCTSIYFLLQGSDFSAFHKLASDEMWHFYAGGTVLVHMLDPAGHHTTLKLGPDLDHGETLQAVVPAGHWFGSCLADRDTYALAGCTVSPGFDFADFEMPTRPELVALYPQHQSLIESLTR